MSVLRSHPVLVSLGVALGGCWYSSSVSGSSDGTATMRRIDRAVAETTPRQALALLSGKTWRTVEGSAGQDILTGGSGGDTFRYESFSEGADWITDFTQSGWRQSGGFPIFLEGDKIDLSAIDARLVTQAGNNSFEFVGDDAFSGDGQVRYYHDDGDTIVEAQSILFQGAEVLTIKLEGLYGLTAADFIL